MARWNSRCANILRVTGIDISISWERRNFRRIILFSMCGEVYHSNAGCRRMSWKVTSCPCCVRFLMQKRAKKLRRQKKDVNDAKTWYHVRWMWLCRYRTADEIVDVFSVPKNYVRSALKPMKRGVKASGKTHYLATTKKIRTKSFWTSNGLSSIPYFWNLQSIPRNGQSVCECRLWSTVLHILKVTLY